MSEPWPLRRIWTDSRSPVLACAEMPFRWAWPAGFTFEEREIWRSEKPPHQGLMKPLSPEEATFLNGES